MSDHDFEKKIQQKMEELKLVPSAGVWTSVEKNIKRDKRRRRAIIWLPLFFLLLGGSGYFLFTSNSSSKSITTTSTTTQTKAPVASNDKNENTQPTKISEKASKPEITSGVGKLAEDNKPGVGLGESNQSTRIVHASKETGKKKSFREKKSVNAVADNTSEATRGLSTKTTNKPKETDHIVTTAGQETMAAALAATKANNDLSKSASPGTTSETIPLDSAQQLTAKKDAADSTLKKIDAVTSSTEKPRSQSKNSSKWKFGLTGYIGMSKSVKGGLGNLFEKSTVADYAFASPTPGASTGGSAYRIPSPVNPGIAFSIGAFTKHNISKRANISIGLQYSYMSTTISIGRRIDSPVVVGAGNLTSLIVGTYYQNSNTHKYTNSFHFIEIPVSIEWKFNEKKKLPFSWESGLQLMQLLATNAVHYDGTRGIYFENSSYFNKTQLGIFTGISFETFRNSKHPLWIGPRVNYFATNLLKKGYAEDQHLFSAGISAKMLLKK